MFGRGKNPSAAPRLPALARFHRPTPYEAPLNPEVELRTDQMTVAESIARIIEYLQVQDDATAISI